MAFPAVNFKITNTEIDDSLKEMTEQKLQSLDKYIGEASSICEVEFEKMTTQQNGNVFRMEVNLQINGTLHRAEAALGSFELALDEVRDELDKELRRARKKRETLFKKGGRKIKEMLRFGGSEES